VLVATPVPPTTTPPTQSRPMFTNLKFFKTPSDPKAYLTFLSGIQSEASKSLTDKCTTLDSKSFKRLLSQKHKIDREVKRVEKIITFIKHNESQKIS